ncbi:MULTISPECIES: hypothetical protein [Pseudomonas]|nr:MULTISPECIES: hypothetical protein [Pseudomonas]MBA1250216.1 hypothetical protein [Pseudomonas zeshuii]
MINLCCSSDTDKYGGIEGMCPSQSADTNGPYIGFDITRVTPELLKSAAVMDDMDEALASIQTECGIESGDVAGLFFSGLEWSDDFGTPWSERSEAERLGWLVSYLDHECMYRKACDRS